MIRNLRTKGRGTVAGFSLLTEEIEGICRECQTYALINDSFELTIRATERQFLLDEEECFLNLQIRNNIPSEETSSGKGIAIPYQRLSDDQYWMGEIEIIYKGCLLSVLNREMEITILYKVMEILRDSQEDYWCFEEHVLYDDPLSSYIAYQLGELAVF